MRTRIIAASSVAALMLAATPIAAASTDLHQSKDRSHHIERKFEKKSSDRTLREDRSRR